MSKIKILKGKCMLLKENSKVKSQYAQNSVTKFITTHVYVMIINNYC